MPERDPLVEEVAGQRVLSPAEVRVLRCIADGMTNREMQAYLHIAHSTIKTHREHIREKLGCRPANAAMVALKRGVIRLLTVALISIQATPTATPGRELMRPVRGGRNVQVMRPVVRLRREVA